MKPPVDEKRTAAARARHAAGVKRLQEAVGLPSWVATFANQGVLATCTRNGMVFGARYPRVKDGCPRRRSPAALARHHKRKRQHAARRRNWPA